MGHEFTVLENTEEFVNWTFVQQNMYSTRTRKYKLRIASECLIVDIQYICILLYYNCILLLQGGMVY